MYPNYELMPLYQAKHEINNQGHKIVLLNEYTMTGELEPEDISESDERGWTMGYFDNRCWISKYDKLIWAIPADLESPAEADEIFLLQDYAFT
jgi:hypothetical protein